MDLQTIILVFPSILLSLTIHECAHGLVALWCGDTTARDAGRLTLNPVAHLDVVGTIMMVLTLLNFMPFGWAKPVPVNPYNFRKPKRDIMLVSLAGPLSNVLFALAIGMLLHLHPFTGSLGINKHFIPFIMYTVQINIGLFIFNLIPIPPLDGSKILMGALPDSLIPGYLAKSRHFGIILIVMLVAEDFLHIRTISLVLTPVWKFVYGLFMYLIALGGQIS